MCLIVNNKVKTLKPRNGYIKAYKVVLLEDSRVVKKEYSNLFASAYPTIYKLGGNVACDAIGAKISDLPVKSFNEDD